MRIGSAHDLRKQLERWIIELVLLQNRVERNVLAVVTQLAIGNVIDNSICYFRPVGVSGKKNKLGFRVDEFTE